jgi:hypothetical protein
MNKLDTRFVNIPTGFKNRIINGDFQIWQRGTSASYVSDSVALTADHGYKSADRIACSNVKAGGQFTVSKSSMNGFNSFKVTVDTPPDNLTWDGTNTRYWYPFRYAFEGQQLYDLVMNRKDITISFLFRSNVAGNFSVCMRNTSYFGATGTWDESKLDAYVTYFEYPGDESVQKIEITIPLDYDWIYGVFNDEKWNFAIYLAFIGDHATTNIINQWQSGTSGNALGAPFSPLCISGYTNWASAAGNYIEIAQLQLEEGTVATDFEYVPYDIQLMRCMRYFYRIPDVGGSGIGIYFNNGTFKLGYYTLPIEMRKTPTVIGYVREVLDSTNHTSVNFHNDNRIAEFHFDNATTTGTTYFCLYQNNLDFDAEL